MTGSLNFCSIVLPIATGIAEPPAAAKRRLDMSALPGGMASAAARTVGTLENASTLNRSISPHMFFTADGFRHPDGDRTIRHAPVASVASVCVSDPPTWNSGMPNKRLLPGLALSIRLQAQA